MTGYRHETMHNARVVAYGDVADLPLVRAFVRKQAHRLGLPVDPVEALAVAVSELVTNTLQHTTAGGQVRIWADDAFVYCDVSDSGAMRTFGRAMPAADAERGRGLAIVERLCDGVTAFSELGSTVVRLRFVRRPSAAPT
ncbi:ATP-binding protein [Micromonospora sp. NPDC000442]|uniref:ATP-binding protein n=1 Tax=Micromonospora sp. NPDC000442 TaxID=3364217 RepID=UPI00367EE365